MERYRRDTMGHGKALYGGIALSTNVTLGKCLPIMLCVVKWTMIEVECKCDGMGMEQ